LRCCRPTADNLNNRPRSQSWGVTVSEPTSMSKRLSAAALCISTAVLGPASPSALATPSTGTYATGGQVAPTVPGGTTPPYKMMATDTTFSYVLLSPTQQFTFGQMTSLSAMFTDYIGGAGGGSPRLRVLLDL